ncbi:hypothetical protein HUU05_23135 [candidate division KSB1 bacterium]|nr:hypothetical protein [candidate division KSB1 bacterium]
MIKPRQLLTYASYALLWCGTVTDISAQNLAQTGNQFTLRTTEVPIEGEYVDAVFYADSVTQELRPKIIIRKESVDFISLSGTLKKTSCHKERLLLASFSEWQLLRSS